MQRLTCALISVNAGVVQVLANEARVTDTTWDTNHRARFWGFVDAVTGLWTKGSTLRVVLIDRTICLRETQTNRQTDTDVKFSSVAFERSEHTTKTKGMILNGVWGFVK